LVSTGSARTTKIDQAAGLECADCGFNLIADELTRLLYVCALLLGLL
jgi:hypothetical protein